MQSYNTKQKDLILKVLKNNKDRLISPGMILDTLSANSTPVGKATLYRFLDMLVLTKEIRKSFNASTGSFEYQIAVGDCSNHLHLKCKNCGRVVHLSCDDTREYIEHISIKHEFMIDQFESTIFGTCRKCMEEI